jgi:hypothetical protein
MRRKSRLRIPCYKDKFPKSVSSLSTAERDRLLELADVALQHPSRIGRIHQRLKQQMKNIADRFAKNRFEFNRRDAP